MLWSATWPKEVEAIAADFLKDPYRVIIGSTELKANHRIAQHFIFLQEAEKYSRLTMLLEKEMDGSKILVFCETKRGCDGVSSKLSTACDALCGYQTVCIKLYSKLSFRCTANSLDFHMFTCSLRTCCCVSSYTSYFPLVYCMHMPLSICHSISATCSLSHALRQVNLFGS